MKILRNIVAILSVISILSIAVPAVSGDWVPKKPVKIVVGYSPGGGTDVVARSIVASAQEFFPVPLVVVNKSGAGGTLAADMVARAKPDGYTLLVAGGSESTSVPNHRKVSYTLDSFRPILRLIRSPIIYISRSDGPLKTVDALVDYAKKNPGKLSFGSSGHGSLYHSTSLVFAKKAGIDMKHVPYKGGAPAIAAMMGGHIDLTCASPDEAKALYEAGKINLLAVASKERISFYPDCKTFIEQGYDVYLENQKGLVAPAGLPDDIYNYFLMNFKKGVDSKAWNGLAKKLNLMTAYLDGPGFKEAMTSMSGAIAKAVKQ